MRLVLGRGKRRQTWTITRADYEKDKKGAEALFIYVGLL
jgi:hypothetical protein